MYHVQLALFVTEFPLVTRVSRLPDPSQPGPEEPIAYRTITVPASEPLALDVADLLRYDDESFHAPALRFEFLEEEYLDEEYVGDPVDRRRGDGLWDAPDSAW